MERDIIRLLISIIVRRIDIAIFIVVDVKTNFSHDKRPDTEVSGLCF